MITSLLRSVSLFCLLFVSISADSTEISRGGTVSGAPTADKREEITGRFIVVFKPNIDGAAAATGRLLRSLRSRQRVHGGSSVRTTSSKPADPNINVVSLLASPAEDLSNVRAIPPESLIANDAVKVAAQAAVSAAEGPHTASSNHGGVAGGSLQGVVLQLPTEEAELKPLLDTVQASADVRVVIRDRELKAALEPGALPDSTTAAVTGRFSSCIESRFLSQGVPGTLTSTAFKWPNCWMPGTQLLWLGRRCGSSRSQIEYTGVLAVDPRTGQVKQTSHGQPCILAADPARGTWHRQRFGRCGVAPLYAARLPTRVCTATSDKGDASCLQAATEGTSAGAIKSVPAARTDPRQPASAGSSLSSKRPAGPSVGRIEMQVTLRSPVQCGAEVAAKLSYTGGSCGPNNGLVRWTAATTPGGCQLQPKSSASDAQAKPGDMKSDQDLFGSCGVPPGNATSQIPTLICSEVPVPDRGSPPAPTDQQPSPASPGIELPNDAPKDSSVPLGFRVPLAPNERVPSGVSRIGAVSSGGIINTLGHSVANQVVVGVVDSGIDGTHPDINVIGGKSWVLSGPTAEDVAASEADALTDAYGHGTHVAGIVAARNNGAGVVGVSPGTPVYSLRVLDDSGRGTLSSVLSVMNWVLTEGLTSGIKVINLSLAAYVNPNTAEYKDVIDVVCSLFQQVSNAGVMVITAAGNYDANMQGYLPAACPAVAAVTALNADGSAMAPFSNWVPESAPQEAKKSVIAAPGTEILSTTSYARDPSGYRGLSGTSMAAPHVAGVAANCLLFGNCSSPKTGYEKLEVIQALAKKQADSVYGTMQSGRYGFQGDGSTSADGKYVGYLVWGGWPGSV